MNGRFHCAIKHLCSIINSIMAQIQQSLLNIPCTTHIACFLYCVQHNTPATFLIPISIMQKYTHDCINICHPVTNHLHQTHQHPIFEPTADRPYTDAIKASPQWKCGNRIPEATHRSSPQFPLTAINPFYRVAILTLIFTSSLYV